MITKGQLRLLEIVQRDTDIEFKVKKFTNNENSVVLESMRCKTYRTVCLSVVKLLSEINRPGGSWQTQALKP